ncbi:MAG: hypothetical protein L0Y56_13430, partial [Nitrospira sp.]|nr:hypothetical protein [Nitrospira sp.]
MDYGQSTTFGDITITAEPAPGGKSGHGYVEYKILITNRSLERTHTVTLVLPETRFSSNRGSYIREIIHERVVSPSSTALIPLLQPPLPLYGEGVAVVIDDQRQREVVPLHFNHYSNYSNMLFVLVSQGVRGDFQQVATKVFEELQRMAGQSSTWSPHERMEFIQSGSPVTDWSVNWLGYTRYDGIVLTRDDLQSLPDR